VLWNFVEGLGTLEVHMATYVITGVKVEDGEVAQAHVQGVGPKHGLGQDGGPLGLNEGRLLDRAALATLTLTDDVYVVRWIGSGEFELGSRVSRKPGEMEYAVSVNDDGTPNSDLLNVAKIN
jgi:hypothetical protein